MDNFNTEFLLENYLTIGNESYRDMITIGSQQNVVSHPLIKTRC